VPAAPGILHPKGAECFLLLHQNNAGLSNLFEPLFRQTAEIRLKFDEWLHRTGRAPPE
jgi:hypothetical protein